MKKLWEYVLCLGDSLTYGARDEFGRGYPAELADILREKTGRVWICLNEGVNGQTSSDVLRRATRLIPGQQGVNIITLLVGTNDTKVPIPEDVYRANLCQIIEIARVFGRHIILGSLPELKSNPWYDQKNASYLGKYNSVVRELAESHSLRVADFAGMGELLVDGVHFDNHGYKEMARRWADQIVQL